LRTAPPSSAWRANERAKRVARVRASGRAHDGRGQVTYQKLVVQAEVGAEGLVRCNIVGRDSVDVGDLLQLGQRVVEGLGLQRAAGRGVLRVEEDHLRLAAGLDVHLPAVLIRQGEGRQLVAFLHGSANDLTNERSASERVHRAVARLDCQPIPTRRLARDGREMEVRTDCIVSLMMNSEVLSERRCTGAPRWGRRDVWCMGPRGQRSVNVLDLLVFLSLLAACAQHTYIVIVIEGVRRRPRRTKRAWRRERVVGSGMRGKRLVRVRRWARSQTPWTLRFPPP